MQIWTSTHAVLLNGAAQSECTLCSTDKISSDDLDFMKATMEESQSMAKNIRICLSCMNELRRATNCRIESRFGKVGCLFRH